MIPPVKVLFNEKDIEDAKHYIGEVLRSGYLTLGKFAVSFEDQFAPYAFTRFAIAVNSGTSALEIPLRIWAPKKVLCPTVTFAATPLAVIHAGATPVFYGLGESYFPDLELIEEAVARDPDIDTLIIQHNGGIVPPEMKEIAEFCRDENMHLLEDAAHAHGSLRLGKPAGSFGDMAAFSFYPTKAMTSGEGGMICTDSELWDAEARIYRDQGKASGGENYHTKLGYNWRMSEIHAVLGIIQLHHLKDFVRGRREAAKTYDEELDEIPEVAPFGPAEGSNYYKYIAWIDEDIDRAKLKAKMRENGVYLSGEVYTEPCHRQPVFAEYPKSAGLGLAEHFCRRHICLPIWPGMVFDDIWEVCESLHNNISEAKP